jgi:hypothetical protein
MLLLPSLVSRHGGFNTVGTEWLGLRFEANCFLDYYALVKIVIGT